MKFETPIGLGEVVIIDLLNKKAKRTLDATRTIEELGKVVAIIFESTNAKYKINYRNQAGFDQEAWCTADELEGDSDFDQELGDYPEGYSE